MRRSTTLFQFLALFLMSISVTVHAIFSPTPLLGKIAIVTGSSSGIGHDTADIFEQAGATVVRADVKPPPGGRFSHQARGGSPQQDISSGPGSTLPTFDGKLFIRTDVKDTDSVQNLVTSTVKKYGRLDIMINNAGISTESQSGRKPIDEYPEGDWTKTLAINAGGTFLGSKYAMKQMKKQKPDENGYQGRIINIASIAAHKGVEGMVGYDASKHAVIGLTRSCALDGAKFGIQCNTVSPGVTDTPLSQTVLQNENVRKAYDAKHPLNGVGAPRNVAIMIFFMSQARWTTGADLAVDGGFLQY